MFSVRNHAFWFVPVLLFSSVTSAQVVTIPLSDYEELRRRSLAAPRPEEPPASPFVLESADIEVRPGADSARVMLRLRLSLYADGFHEIPIPRGGNLTEVELGDLEGRVRVSEQGRHLVVRGRGRHQVTIESVVSISEDEEAARPTRLMSFESPFAAVVRGSILRSGLGESTELEMNAGGLVTSASRGAGTDENDVWNFVGQPGAAVQLKFLGESRVPDRAGLPLRFEMDSASLTHASRNQTTVTSRLHARVLQGQLGVLRIQLPLGFRVTSIQPVDLSWDVFERGEDRVLELRPSAPALEEFTATVQLVGDPSSEFAIPILVSDEAIRSKIAARLSVDAGGIPIVVEMGSTRQLEANELSELPSFMREGSGHVFAVRHPREVPRFLLEWSEESQSDVLAAQVDRLVVDAIYGESALAGYQCWVVLRSSGLTKLTMQMPEGFELHDAWLNDTPVAPARSPSGLEIPLLGGPASQTILISGILTVNPVLGDGELELPVPSLSVPVAGVEVRAVLPGERAYSVRGPHVRPYFSDAPGLVSVEAGGSAAGRYFEALAGYQVVGGSWSSLRESPQPLVIDVKPRRSKRRWF